MILQLYFVEELNLDEIGETLGCWCSAGMPDQKSRARQDADDDGGLKGYA